MSDRRPKGMKRSLALLSLVLLPVAPITGCSQQPPAAAHAEECGKTVSGVTDSNKLQVFSVPIRKESLGVEYRGRIPSGDLNAYLTKNGVVVGRNSRAPQNGKGDVDTLCSGTTWDDVTKFHIYDYQVSLVLHQGGDPQKSLLASQPVFAHLY
ncbi:hypothetical protein [Kitasatospora viridis]|uniref:Uncharacterized protein n=1 Tax=Kitasatospora viridis TaxID=281105 RepID=A0A561SEC8_9ACTN|nr:hypothetical protein [Kitasatospora viridis]TWF73220.1 hypothetical protein FHX73_16371 [Kitasatospora viridis]